MTDATSLRTSILRAIETKPRNDRELSLALSRYAPVHILATVRTLAEEKLVALRWSRWRITASGRVVLPRMQTLPPMAPYKAPPAPPRRANSDHSHIPSRYGDTRALRQGRIE